MRFVCSVFLAFALLSCGRAPNKMSDEAPPDAPVTIGAPEGKLSGDWRELFGPFGYPESLRAGVTYQCPDMPDVSKFARSLWPLSQAAYQKWDRDRQRAMVNSQDMPNFDKDMLAQISLTGCRQAKDVVLVDKVIVWDSLGGRPNDIRDEYVNAPRWIAYKGIGKTKGFYLTRSATVD